MFIESEEQLFIYCFEINEYFEFIESFLKTQFEVHDICKVIFGNTQSNLFCIIIWAYHNIWKNLGCNIPRNMKGCQISSRIIRVNPTSCVASSCELDASLQAYCVSCQFPYGSKSASSHHFSNVSSGS